MIEPHTLISIAVDEDRPAGNPVETAVCKTLDDLHPPTFGTDGSRATGYTFETHTPAADPGAVLGLLHIHDQGGIFETLAVPLPSEVAEWLADHAAGNSPGPLEFEFTLPIII